MSNVIEAVYEDGVLKPLAANSLKEHQLYRLICEEAEFANGRAAVGNELMLPPHLAHRLDVLPNGRRVIRFSGALAASPDDWPDDYDPIAVALEEIRQEQRRLQAEEWDEFYPVEPHD